MNRGFSFLAPGTGTSTYTMRENNHLVSRYHVCYNRYHVCISFCILIISILYPASRSMRFKIIGKHDDSNILYRYSLLFIHCPIVV